MDPCASDEGYQEAVLPHVSRTFALTIPLLPAELRKSVTNAYLLCRIADTIEDEPALSPLETLHYLDLFKRCVVTLGDPTPLARELVHRLSDRTLQTERDLVANMDRVLRVTASLSAAQRPAIQRCVELMCYGMPRFQSTASLNGLPRIADLDDYCYYVAGVVGEMLTDLFCSHDPRIEARRAGLTALATSFAQGLQMTNILKDQWEDRRRGACWLPQEVFLRHGVALSTLSAEPHDERYARGLHELVAMTHAHLRNALEYSLLIPPEQTGIRRFCLWAIGLAVLTLRKIDGNPRFTGGAQVKVSHFTVGVIKLSLDAALRRDWLLRRLFSLAAGPLPVAVLGDLARPHSPRLEAAVNEDGLIESPQPARRVRGGAAS